MVMAVALAWTALGPLATQPAEAGPAVRERVSFALAGEDGAGLGAAFRVHLYGADGEAAPVVETGAEGQARYDGLPAGIYTVWVEPPGDAGLAASVFQAVAVGAGDRTLAVPLGLPRAGTVRGLLHGPDGQPLVGHTVSVQSATAPDAALDAPARRAERARGAIGCYAEAETGPDGSFAITALAPGSLSLDVTAPGERLAAWSVPSVEVKAGEVTDLGTLARPAAGWEYLFDGATMAGWRESGLAGQRPVTAAHGALVLPTGDAMTGITRVGEAPTVGYELTLAARRTAGSDFFCGLTFPVADSHCSLILGGWGGSVVGLSSLDGMDASQNETSRWIEFEEQRWYRVRVRVTTDRISCWLDDRPIVDVVTDRRRISTRWEMDRCKPLGFATWRTTGELRDIRLGRLPAAVAAR
jgi:hypothetical protein